VVQCRNGILHTNAYTMSHDALSRCAAPRRSVPALLYGEVFEVGNKVEKFHSFLQPGW
jgi:hypothetical protein